MPTRYVALGPLTLPYEKNKHGTKLITKSSALTALVECGLDTYRGCYIFGISVGAGSVRPYYVGRTAKSFGAECFEPHKIVKYNEVLHRVTLGKPIMLFAAPSSSKGKFSDTAAAALEQYLIGLAYQVNGDITNVHGIPKPLFEIEGVHLPKKGPKGKSLETLCRTFDL